jgi:hypothetical protein
MDTWVLNFLTEIHEQTVLHLLYSDEGFQLKHSTFTSKWVLFYLKPNKFFPPRIQCAPLKSNLTFPSFKNRRAALGTESRVCYLGNTADRQTQWALTHYHLSQSTANLNRKLIHCHHWDLNLWSSGCERTSLTTHPSRDHPLKFNKLILKKGILTHLALPVINA